MGILSFQILLINFIVAGLITGLLYFVCKSVRTFNPILLFIVSCIGTFVGTIVAMFMPSVYMNTESVLFNNVVLSVPGITLSFLFIFVWVKGSKSQGYF